MKQKSKIICAIILLVIIIAVVLLLLLLPKNSKNGNSSNPGASFIDDAGEIEIIIPEGQTGEGF